MFHSIPEPVKKRMAYLETMAEGQRGKDIDPCQRLRQIPPETGKFLAMMAVRAPEGTFIEIGTSGGYSALWLSLACGRRRQRLVTFEIEEAKVRLARETFKEAGLEDMVTIIHGDARKHLAEYRSVGFCFLDAEKHVYGDCYDLLVPNMVSGGILIADNILSHKTVLGPFVDRVFNDERVDALVIPIGSGLLACTRG